MRVIHLIIFSIIASSVAFFYFPSPLVWISLVWSAVFIYATIRDPRTNIKPIWFNIGFAILVIGGIETYLWLAPKQNKLTQNDYRSGYVISDEIRGYAAVKGSAVLSEKFYEAEPLYRVTYTINSQGLRITPSVNKNPTGECVLFFGGSFTFGEGVNDEESMPYLVGARSEYETHNFAFHGYGPHQMLSILEHGLVEDIIECQPKFGIYQTLVYHVERSAGYSSWDNHGPWYTLLPNGQIKYMGHFDDQISKKVTSHFRKSHIYNKLFANKVTVREIDIELFLGIVATSKKTFEENYPGATFQVIFWDTGQNHEKIVAGLRKRDIQVHLVSDIFSVSPGHIAEYQLNPQKGEHHPNPLAHRLIAEYILANIIND